MFADVLLENDLLFTFRLYLSIMSHHKLHLASVLIVSDQDFTDFHIVKELIDTNINAIKPYRSSSF